MRSLTAGVVDYGMGNLHSVAKALTVAGAKVVVTNNKAKLQNSDLLVLPGVGSFGAAMKNLSKNRLDDFVRTWIDEGKPFFGICLGLQLLFERSEEDPKVKGLGAFPGDVVRFRLSDFKKGAYQVPHMGWNNAESNSETGDTFFRGLSKTDYFYFVHTYFPVPQDGDSIASKTVYGKPFCSSISVGNVFATQFHPEKSGTCGLALLKNVIRKTSEVVRK